MNSLIGPGFSFDFSDYYQAKSRAEKDIENVIKTVPEPYQYHFKIHIFALSVVTAFEYEDLYRFSMQNQLDEEELLENLRTIYFGMRGQKLSDIKQVIKKEINHKIKE